MKRSVTKWIVAWLCCIVNFMQFGPARLASMLLLVVMDRYNVSRSKAALPFTLVYAMTNSFDIVFCAGPLVGYLSNRFGVYRIILIGSVLSSAAVICCFFAKDIIMFTILWTGAYGFGIAMGTTLLPQILNQHFGTKCAMANGISMIGISLGGLLLPNVAHELLNSYKLSGTLLIFGAFILNGLPACILLEFLKEDTTKRHFDTDPITEIQHSENDCTKQQQCQQLKAHDPTVCLRENCNRPEIKLDHSVQKRCNCFLEVPKHSIGEINANPTYESENHDSQIIEGLSSSEIQSASIIKPKSSPFWVYLDPTYIVIVLIQSAFLYINIMIITIAIDLGRDFGVQKQNEPYLLIAFSVSDVIGRLCLGSIPDNGLLTIIQFTSVNFSILGAIFLLSMFLSGFGVCVTLLCIQGLSIGGMFCALPGVCTKYVEKEYHIVALSSRFMLLLPMSLTQAPLIGYFKEQFGSYHGLLILLSVMCFVCGMLNCYIPFSAKRKDRTRITN